MMKEMQKAEILQETVDDSFMVWQGITFSLNNLLPLNNH